TGTKAGLTCVIGMDNSAMMCVNDLLFTSEWVMLSASKDLAERLQAPTFIVRENEVELRLPYADLVRRYHPVAAPPPPPYWTASAPMTRALTDDRPEVLEEYRVDRMK